MHIKLITLFATLFLVGCTTTTDSIKYVPITDRVEEKETNRLDYLPASLIEPHVQSVTIPQEESPAKKSEDQKKPADKKEPSGYIEGQVGVA
jgi:hypothetical protein